MALKTGIKAPDFTLKSKTVDGLVEVNLYEQLKEGKVVLLFFPLAFTSVCQEELCSVSSGIDLYQDLGAKVFAISVDSPFAQEGFAKASSVTIPFLSDFNKKTSKDYDVLYSTFLPGILDLDGVSKRSAFVINQQGNIDYAWSSDDPKNLPPFEEIQNALKL